MVKGYGEDAPKRTRVRACAHSSPRSVGGGAGGKNGTLGAREQDGPEHGTRGAFGASGDWESGPLVAALLTFGPEPARPTWSPQLSWAADGAHRIATTTGTNHPPTNLPRH